MHGQADTGGDGQRERREADDGQPQQSFHDEPATSSIGLSSIGIEWDSRALVKAFFIYSLIRSPELVPPAPN